MAFATMVLAILFLSGFNVGTPLAICEIIVGVLQTIIDICKIIQKKTDY